MAKSFWFYSPIDDETFTATFTAGFPGDPAISGNVNVTEDGLCFGQIKADPDIAGWGVRAYLVLEFHLCFNLLTCLDLRWIRLQHLVHHRLLILVSLAALCSQEVLQ